MNDTAPKPFVFVLMPFDNAFDDIYQLGIKSVAAEVGAYAERVDEQTYDGTVLERIYNQISKADIIVADMSRRNANVFYETGYAHALEKRVILLTQEAGDIPFDLKTHPHIVYGSSIQRLREELSKWLRWAIDNPRQQLSSLVPPIQLFIGRMPLTDNPSFIFPQDSTHPYLRILVDAHNSTERDIRPVSFRLCLLSSDRFTHTIEDHRRGGLPAARLPGGGRMHVFTPQHEILPGGWLSWIRLDLENASEPLAIGSEHQFVLRMLTEGKPLDFPFKITIGEPVKKK